MNEQQARTNGYQHHGAYSTDKEVVKERAAQLRAAGNKAVVVTIPPNKYSRGSRSTGYSVYWIESEANKRARQEENRQKEIAQQERTKEELLRQLAAVEQRLTELRAE